MPDKALVNSNSAKGGSKNIISNLDSLFCLLKNEFVFYEGVDAHVGYFTNDNKEAQKELIKATATFLAEIIN